MPPRAFALTFARHSVSSSRKKSPKLVIRFDLFDFMAIDARMLLQEGHDVDTAADPAELGDIETQRDRVGGRPPNRGRSVQRMKAISARGLPRFQDRTTHARLGTDVC